MQGFLLINARSGSGRPDARELAEEAGRRGIRTRVLQAGEDATALAKAADAPALGIAGGDGSLAAVAAVALDRELPFVCVPFGTRNHFARDLGLDRNDPIAALAAFEGEERRIDVGRVGDGVFLNNVSLGIYARLVHRRERNRRRREAFARARALAILLRHRHALDVSIDGRRLRAPVVLVANNHYRLDLLSLGERERLDDGLLHLYAPAGLLPSAWEERTATRFTIAARTPALRAAIDGEPAVLDSPVEFRIEPRALRVLVPPS